MASRGISSFAEISDGNTINIKYEMYFASSILMLTFNRYAQNNFTNALNDVMIATHLEDFN